MPLITRKTELLQLHNPTNTYRELTGGWTLDRGDMDYVFATDQLVNTDIVPDNQPYLIPDLIIGDDTRIIPDLGAIVVLARKKMEDFTEHTITYKTNQPINFIQCKWLKFIFSRDNSVRINMTHRREFVISLEDETGETVYKEWHCGDRLGHYERGLIDVSDVSEAYIAIRLTFQLSDKVNGGYGYFETLEHEPFFDNEDKQLVVSLKEGFVIDDPEFSGGFFYSDTAAAMLSITDMWVENY